MNLQKLYNALVKKQVIPPSRIDPIKSSLKRYARALGYPDWASCPESAYNIPPEQYKRLIAENPTRITKSIDGSNVLSTRALTNIKHDISFTLREGATLGLIVGRYEPTGLIRASAAQPIFQRGQTNTVFFRGETKNLPKIALSEKNLPPALRTELDAYYQWATEEFVSSRPRSRKRRPISANYDRGMLKRIAGFHVKGCGFDINKLTLESLTNHIAAERYVEWFMSHHGRATITLKNVVICLISLADYLKLTANDSTKLVAMTEASRKLKTIRDRLPEYVAVRDKRKCWLSLEQIEMCGINRYPRNATRIAAASKYVRRTMHFLKADKHHTYRGTAVDALKSLLIRLMVRIPLRLRNFMEMSWNPRYPERGKNLFREDGFWYLRFSGSELKVSSRRGKVNSILHRVPNELTWLVEEVLTLWRPLITGVPYQLPHGDEGLTAYKEPPQTKAPEYKNSPDDVLLFLNSDCNPARRDNIRDWVKSTTYVYTGVSVYPHLLRDIWATTYIKRTGDFIGAAKRLGDTIETVMKHYAHLLDDDAEAKGDAFNRLIFGVDVIEE